MNITKKCAAMLVALSVIAPVTLISAQAQAQGQSQQQRYQGAPRIEGFNVDEVRRLDPGTDLNFTLYGTPGGTATLKLAGAQRGLTLSETYAGQYEGTYTISRSDRLVARSSVTANLRVGNQVASTVLNESLQIGVGVHSKATAPGPMPRIERFTVQPSSTLTPGSELAFNLRGTPGAKVVITIDGGRGKFFLPEVTPGEYSGFYTVRNGDRVAPNCVVTATMDIDQRVSTMKLGQSLQSASAPVVRACLNCGTVEAVNVVDVKGEGGYLGAIGGGLVGALIGRQVGSGNGRTAAQIAGAVGGAYAGRAIEGKAKSGQHYEVVVRLENGATQTVAYENDPGFRTGEKVSIANGTLTRL